MPNKIVEDVKTGIKGVRGAADTLRGDLMAAADRTFDNDPNHPETQASERRNQAIAEQGRRDMQAVDDRLAEHEARKDKASNASQPNASQPGAVPETSAGEASGLAGNGAGAAKGTGHHPLPLP